MIAAGRTLVVLVLLVAGLVLAPVPGGQLPPAEAATPVAHEHCRRVDPNLVRGVCLRYRARTGSAYTWIGTYRASNGRVFFCIDYLYDSRISGKPTIRSTQGLVNQLGRKIGDAEVAALNYLVSTWAAHGSTGSDTRDAAIALIIRELMSDGVRPDGTVVYPRGLKVGQRVRPPIGGLRGPVMVQAQQMWSEASRYRGGYRLSLTSSRTGPVELGTSRRYAVAVRSAAGHRVPGVTVRFTCTGPVRCPATATTAAKPVAVVLTPRSTGESTVTATAAGPAADGRIYQVGGWHTHGGSSARERGVQRGWIAERRPMTARVRASAEIVKGTPVVLTRASHTTAQPGTLLHDVVTVSKLPAGYLQTVTAHLYGPFAQPPGPGSCAPTSRVGSVGFTVDHNGEFRTPGVSVVRPGYYTWTEELPGDRRTHPVLTPCGVVEETTLVVPRTPVVLTQVSAQRALVGRSVHDTVLLSGLAATDRVLVRWTLHGPLSPRDGSCRGLDWSGSGVLDRGEFLARGSGRFRTASTLLRKPGCVTYSESVAASTTTTAVTSPPGLVTETALVTRPVIPVVPEIPSGPDSRSADQPTLRARPQFLIRRYQAPRTLAARARRTGTLRIPSVRIAAPVLAVGLDRGAMAIPDDPSQVGWLRATAAAGDRIGASVLSGHVSDRRDRPGALSRLRSIRAGARITWVDARGVRHRFVVTAVRRYPRSVGVPAKLFRVVGPHVLHLVTCADRVRTSGGGFHYTSNLVVTAREVGPATG